MRDDKNINLRKKQIRTIVVMILAVVFVSMISYSTIHVYLWIQDNHKTTKQLETIQNVVQIEERESDVDTEIIPQEEEIPRTNFYWEYIKMPLIQVDFRELKKINPDVRGWISIGGTNIHYPFVQGKDNTYYLTHSFDQTSNQAGWVFLDYRNKIDVLDQNTILYAHGRVDKTMFGTLKDLLQKSWYTNSKNHVIQLSTEKENSLWQIFSVYHLPTTSDYLQTQFSDDQTYLQFLTMLQKRSVHFFDTTLNKKDHILTLSTCYNNSEKMVVHAKLIKKEIRG